MKHYSFIRILFLLTLGLSVCVSSCKDDMKALYKKATTAHQNEEYQKAVELFERILKEYPDHSMSRKARYELGKMYLYKLKQPQKALKHLQDLYALSEPGKYSLESLKLIGHIYETSLNSCLDSVEAYRLLLKDYASNPDVDAAEYQFAIAECYFKQDDYQLAMDEYKLLTEQYPESRFSPHAKFQIANVYTLLEDWEQAIALHEELLLSDRLTEQLSADNKLELAFCYEENERFEEALTLYDELLTVNSENVVIDLGLVERKIERAREALEESKKGPGKVDWKRRKRK